MKSKKEFFNAMLHDVSHSTAETAETAETAKIAETIVLKYNKFVPVSSPLVNGFTKSFMLNFLLFMKSSLLIILFLSILISVSSCERENIDTNNTVVKIAGKDIGKAEFIRRAEYTIRPNYCRKNSNIDKKIILNSIIAEKMLALEAENNIRLEDSSFFPDFIKGRKEQAMRQMMYHDRIYEKVVLDKDRLSTVYQRAGRIYDLEYLTFPKPETGEFIKQKLLKNIPFKDVITEITGLDTIPRKTLSWNEQASNNIRKALYTDEVYKGKIIGPFLSEEDYNYTIIKVKGWQDSPAISEQQQEQRAVDSKDWLKQEDAVVLYEKYIKKLMKGKRIQFSYDAFQKFVKKIAPLYLSMPDLMQSTAISKDLNKKMEAIETLHNELDNFISDENDIPILEIDNKIITVGELQKEIEIHPLVFRIKRLTKQNITKQLKLAIVDLMRDKYVTKDAYKRGYDNHKSVKGVVDLWQDAYIANKMKEEYLSGFDITDKSDDQILEQILNPYIDELQKKYGPQIRINTDLFDSIKLSRIDMFVLQKNVPYPIVVPPFPIITTDKWLDYGKKLENTR